jgi:hypothetical protein
MRKDRLQGAPDLSGRLRGAGEPGGALLLPRRHAGQVIPLRPERSQETACVV